MSSESQKINSKNKSKKTKNYGTIKVENRSFSTDHASISYQNSSLFTSLENINEFSHSNQHDHQNNNNSNNSRKSNLSNAKTFVINYIEQKYLELQRKNFKILKFRHHFKLIRKILHLNKNPKRKGYDKFLSDEDKRWLENYYMNNSMSHYEPRWIAGMVSIGDICQYGGGPV
uniref:CSON004839 protein n=1 Tax=Culicoides sonorensis TaxID=179676 RepID=A0A336LY12_CULSO